MTTDPTTLDEARARFRRDLDDGTTCPCCQKHGQRYRRGLNSTMVRELIWLVNASGPTRRWVNVSEEAPAHVHRSRQLPSTAFWHLTEHKPNDDPTKASSGIWRPTEAGVAFVHRTLKVPKYVHEYGSTPERWSGPSIGVIEALRGRFDYGELMSGGEE